MALNYTLYVFKQDRRCKEGERLVSKYDYKDVSASWMLEEISDLRRTTHKPIDGYRLEFTDTYVTRKNHITGESYEERHDTPNCCSPSSSAASWSTRARSLTQPKRLFGNNPSG